MAIPVNIVEIEFDFTDGMGEICCSEETQEEVYDEIMFSTYYVDELTDDAVKNEIYEKSYICWSIKNLTYSPL